MKNCLLRCSILVLGLYLGLSNGHLAIFTDTDTRPLQVLPYDTAVFTAQDRQALTKGIPFSTAVELSRLLEDYTS